MLKNAGRKNKLVIVHFLSTIILKICFCICLIHFLKRCFRYDINKLIVHQNVNDIIEVMKCIFLFQKKNEWKQNSQESYADIIRENKDFEHYYKTQNVVPENEWDAFLNRMKENLPVAFRITGSKSETNTLLEIIKGDLFKELLNSKLENNELDSEKRVVPHCLPFYPDELAWQLQLTRKDIRRSEAFHRLHNFLIMETSTGNISRQEVVSMIPPLVLDVKPWHKVNICRKFLESIIILTFLIFCIDDKNHNY